MASPITVALVDDYDVVVIGVANILEQYRDRVVIAEMPIHEAWVGHRLFDLEAAAGGRVAYISRLGEGLIPGADTVYQDGDLVHLALDRARLAEAERVLDAAPATH